MQYVIIHALGDDVMLQGPLYEGQNTSPMSAIWVPDFRFRGVPPELNAMINELSSLPEDSDETLSETFSERSDSMQGRRRR
jgi:hypothetical protein